MLSRSLEYLSHQLVTAAMLCFSSIKTVSIPIEIGRIGDGRNQLSLERLGQSADDKPATWLLGEMK